MDKRPSLNKSISLEDFQAFYWLKKELTAFCKQEEINSQGSKLDVSARIEQYLETGLPPIANTKKRILTSSFDWQKEVLSPDTVLTDNYKNSENVRAFFKQHIGKSFKFNVVFMDWLKTNQGKTLSDAIEAWHRIANEKKARTELKVIAPQFEYNTYIRDFLKDNPGKSKATAISFWKLKKAKRGDNVYRRSDLD